MILGVSSNSTVEFHDKSSVVPSYLGPTPPQNQVMTQQDGTKVRTMHNKCAKSRVQLGEKVVRCVSFFASHPSMCLEDQWLPHHINDDFLLIDTYTARLMAECECQLLVDPDDQQAEPTIMAVEMRMLKKSADLGEMMSNVTLK